MCTCTHIHAQHTHTHIDASNTNTAFYVVPILLFTFKILHMSASIIVFTFNTFATIWERCKEFRTREGCSNELVRMSICAVHVCMIYECCAHYAQHNYAQNLLVVSCFQVQECSNGVTRQCPYKDKRW